MRAQSNHSLASFDTIAAEVANSERACHASEKGSAYIVALLVLVVLSVIGIALTLVTQTEVQIGANEANQNKTFYSADSWSSLVKPYLVHRINTKITFQLNNSQYKDPTNHLASATFADEVTVLPEVPINVQNAQLTDIADQNFKTITNVMNSGASRTGFATVSGTAQQVPFNEKTIGLFLIFTPFQPSVFYTQSQDVTNSIMILKF